MEKIIKFLAVNLILLLTLSATTEKPWVKHLDKNGVQVYLRECNGCEVKEFKAQTIIKAPMPKVIALLLDINSIPKWIYANRGTFLLEKKNINEFIYYTIIDCPRPTLDRDLIVDFKVAEQSDKKYVIKTSTIPKYIAEKPNLVRVKVFSGSWELVKISETETQVTTTCYSEPGGTVPTWLINTFIVTGPYNTLLSMQDLLIPKAAKK